MLNQSIITGRLTKDVELKKVNDRSVVSFTLASSRDYKTEDGSYPADFIDCVLWGAPAEKFNTLTAKGDTLKEARAKAYEATEWVDFDNKYMRHDIGKAIDETEE